MGAALGSLVTLNMTYHDSGDEFEHEGDEVWWDTREITQTKSLLRGWKLAKIRLTDDAQSQA